MDEDKAQAWTFIHMLTPLKVCVERAFQFGNSHSEAVKGFYSLYHDAFEEAIRCIKIVNGLQDQDEEPGT